MIAATEGDKASRLRALAMAAYWAAQTPKEAKMAGILLDLFAPDVACAADGVPYRPTAHTLHLNPPARYRVSPGPAWAA